MFNLCKKTPSIATTQVLAALAPTIAPETVTRAPALTPTLAPALFAASIYTEPPPSSAFTPGKVGASNTNITYCIVGGVELKLDI